MKKLLLSLLLGLLCVPLNLHAASIPAANLNGLHAGYVYIGNDAQWQTPVSLFSGSITCTSSTLTLNNFLGGFDITFDYKPSTGTISLTLPAGGNSYSGHGDKQGQTLKLIGATEFYSSYGYATFADSYGYPFTPVLNGTKAYSATISTDTNGYVFTLGTPFCVEIRNRSNQLTAQILYHDLKCYMYSTNATATNTGSTLPSYDVRLKLYESNSSPYIEIGNWANLGITYQYTANSRSNVKTTYQQVASALNLKTNKISIGGKVRALMFNKWYGRGTFLTNKYPNGLDTYWILGYKNPTTQGNDIYYASSSNTSNTNIEGTVSGLEYQHLNTSNYWYNGSYSFTTQISGSNNTTIDFGSNYVVCTSTADVMRSATSTRIVGSMIGTFNYTHTISLNANTITGNTSSITLSGSLQSASNSDLVSSYDLYIIPGQVSLSSDILDPDTGIKDAVKITGLSLSPSSLSFNKSITDPALIKGIAKAGKATLFVKVNYNSSTNLHPTFHALKNVNASITTPTPAAPTFTLLTPANEETTNYVFNESIKVAINQSEGADVYYTVVDGTTNTTTPSASSNRYTSPLVFDHTVTIKAVAISEYGFVSDAVTQTVVKKPQEVVVNVTTDAPGSYDVTESNSPGNPYLYVTNATVNVHNPNLQTTFIRYFIYCNDSSKDSGLQTASSNDLVIPVPDDCKYIRVLAIKDGELTPGYDLYFQQVDRPAKPTFRMSINNGQTWNITHGWFQEGESLLADILPATGYEDCELYYTVRAGASSSSVTAADCTTQYVAGNYVEISEFSTIYACAVNSDGIRSNVASKTFNERPGYAPYEILGQEVPGETLTYVEEATMIIKQGKPGDKIYYKINDGAEEMSQVEIEINITETTKFEFWLQRGAYGNHRTVTVKIVDDMQNGTVFDPANASHLESEVRNETNYGSFKKTFIICGVDGDGVVKAAAHTDPYTGDGSDLDYKMNSMKIYYGEDGCARIDLDRIRDFYLGHDGQGYYFWCGIQAADKSWQHYVLCTDLRTNSLFLMDKKLANQHTNYDYHVTINFDDTPAKAPARVAASETESFPYTSISFDNGNTLNLFDGDNYFAAGPNSGMRMALFVSRDSSTTGIENVEVGSSEAVYYDLQGFEVAHPRNGHLYIVRRGEVVTKEVYNEYAK